MEIGIYQNGCGIAVNVIADDVATAATLADPIASDAPAGVQVWQEGTVVAVFRRWDSRARQGNERASYAPGWRKAARSMWNSVRQIRPR